jgi:hypothetical protein
LRDDQKNQHWAAEDLLHEVGVQRHPPRDGGGDTQPGGHPRVDGVEEAGDHAGIDILPVFERGDRLEGVWNLSHKKRPFDIGS